MKTQLVAMFSLFMLIAMLAGADDALDLSSPMASLKSYLEMQRKGAQLKEFKSLVSKENFAAVSSMVGAFGEALDPSEMMPPEDKYTKLTIIRKEETADRAFIQLKVKYKELWLKAEQKENGTDEISAGRKHDETISDASPGEDYHYPLQINGDGYVSFLFLKQEGKWRFHKSYASSQPADFTPLLGEKDLSSRFTAKKVSAEPAPFKSMSTSFQNKVDPKGGLSGTFNGKPWVGKYAYLSMFNKDDKDYYSINVCAQNEPDKYARMGIQSLIVKLPKNVGVYDLTSVFNVTFYTPPNKNVVASEGSMTVAKEGSVYIVKMVARADHDNELSGEFIFEQSE